MTATVTARTTAARGRAALLGCVLTWALLLGLPAAVAAQDPAPFAIRGFGDVSLLSFTAKESFETIFGSSTGWSFGGGVDVVTRKHLFGSLRASRFRREGERVFVFGGEIFPLGTPTTVTITPLEVTVGYRVDRGWRVVPYGGGGVGWHRYEETSPGAIEDEDAKETFLGYHIVGGAEIAIARWLSAAGEGQWTAVPEALGQDPNGVSGFFGEDDLGGASVRVKVIVGWGR